jgi:hypothetical protein
MASKVSKNSPVLTGAEQRRPVIIACHHTRKVLRLFRESKSIANRRR